jgi:hypothetical protein
LSRGEAHSEVFTARYEEIAHARSLGAFWGLVAGEDRVEALFYSTSEPLEALKRELPYGDVGSPGTRVAGMGAAELSRYFADVISASILSCSRVTV